MSPMPKKLSADVADQPRKVSLVKQSDVQGTTGTRFGLFSQTSARSSIMTTMLVSTGNSRFKDFCVRPVRKSFCLSARR